MATHVTFTKSSRRKPIYSYDGFSYITSKVKKYANQPQKIAKIYLSCQAGKKVRCSSHMAITPDLEVVRQPTPHDCEKNGFTRERHEYEFLIYETKEKLRLLSEEDLSHETKESLQERIDVIELESGLDFNLVKRFGEQFSAIRLSHKNGAKNKKESTHAYSNKTARLLLTELNNYPYVSEGVDEEFKNILKTDFFGDPKEFDQPDVDLNWCRYCGCDEILADLEREYAEIAGRIINIEPFEINLCLECLDKVIEIEIILKKAENVTKLLTDMKTQSVKKQPQVNELRTFYGLDPLAIVNLFEGENIEEDYEDSLSSDEDPDDIFFTNFDFFVNAAKTLDEEWKPKKKSSEYYFNFNCFICNETFKNFSDLKAHCNDIHNCPPRVTCSCGEFLRSYKNLRAHRVLHFPKKDEKFFKCHLCSMKLMSEKSFENHLKLRHPDGNKKQSKLLVCQHCGGSFRGSRIREHILKSHLSEIEQRKVMCCCDLCDKMFVRKRELEKHIKVNHLKKYVDICEICGAEFSSSVALIEHHSSKHKQIPDIKCDHCDELFLSKMRMKRHVAREHLGRTFSCEFCTKSYFYKTNLKRHLTSHQENLC